MSNLGTTVNGFAARVTEVETTLDDKADTSEVDTKLSSKADTELSNITSAAATNLNSMGIRTVVETYINGTSWYRKWSDGWVEQGGYVYPKTTSTATVTLTLPYANTDYTIMVVGVYSTNHGEVVQNSNKKTTSFNIVAGYASNFGVYWWTAGQGAS